MIPRSPANSNSESLNTEASGPPSISLETSDPKRQVVENGVEAALHYAKCGWFVFPCRLKYPAVPKQQGGKGCHDATTDSGQIERWESAHPGCNWAIACGPSGLIVIDVDEDDAKDKHGLKQWLALKEWLHIPETLSVQTPRGGRHEYFLRSGAEVSNSRGDLPKDIDVRGVGGYVLAPRSADSTGRRYEWINPSMPIAPLPGSLLAVLAARRHVQRAAPRLLKAPGTVGETFTEGSRNQSLASLAGRLRRAGFSPDAIADALHIYNIERCQPPLPEGEVERIARSISRYPPARPRRVRRVAS